MLNQIQGGGGRGAKPPAYAQGLGATGPPKNNQNHAHLVKVVENQIMIPIMWRTCFLHNSGTDKYSVNILLVNLGCVSCRILGRESVDNTIITPQKYESANS